MQTKILPLTLSFLLLFASIGQAQQRVVVGLSAPLTFAEYDDIEVHFGDIETLHVDIVVGDVVVGLHADSIDHAMEMEAAMMEAAMKQMFRMMWNDSGTGFMSAMLLDVPEIREALGVSDEQLGQMNDAVETKMLEMSEKMESEMKRIMLPVYQSLDPDLTLDTLDSFLDSFDPDSLDLDPETLQQLSMEFGEQMMEQMMSISMNMMSEVMADVMGEFLLPEQIQSIQEMQLVAMGEFPFISPGAFEALGLTDDQREELERIKKELEPEFEENLDFFVKNWLKLEEEDCEETMKHLMNEIQTRSREFSTRFRTQMFDVLTDEQWMRLEELIDNPPEHARLFIRMIRETFGLGAHEENEGSSESDEATGIWMPGPGSWQPGDPIPAEYRQQRNMDRRFPRQ